MRAAAMRSVRFTDSPLDVLVEISAELLEAELALARLRELIALRERLDRVR